MDKKRGNHLNLSVGNKIKIGEKSSKVCGIVCGTTIELIQGYFEHDNGLYCETQTAPSIWNEECKEFDSIFHIFGNDLECFLDSEVIV